MDTSEKYIKMCDCPEIQGQRCRHPGEVACFVTRHLYISKSFDYWIMFAEKPGHVWLPRQDQIQEMVGDFNMVLPMLPRLGRLDKKHSEVFTSMEQLWLAFYMWEKHKKTWDGKKWVA